MSKVFYANKMKEVMGDGKFSAYQIHGLLLDRKVLVYTDGKYRKASRVPTKGQIPIILSKSPLFQRDENGLWEVIQ